MDILTIDVSNFAKMTIIEELWWQFMPGETISVRWPVGLIEINESMPQWDWTLGPPKYFVESADSNEHYRPWLEENVGRQKWDWNWNITPFNKFGNTRLSIKFRRKHSKYATIAKLMWS
jgi:hypothetical protein